MIMPMVDTLGAPAEEGERIASTDVTITWRSARVDDVPAITAVLRASEELAGGHEMLSEQSMRE